MSDLNKVDQSIAATELWLKKLRAKRDELLRLTLVTCRPYINRRSYNAGCGSQFEIQALTYIQTHWYVSPHGCTEGDYWKEGEGQWKCPSCGHVNRLYDQPEITKLKRLFRDVEETYDHR